MTSPEGAGGSIELRALAIGFTTRRARIDVLDSVDLSVPSGTMMAIVGPSGSGKSSLLYAVAGLVKPSAGEILVNDCRITDLSPDSLALYRLRTIGLIFQSFHLMHALTAVQNVALPARLAGRSRADALSKASGLLDAMGLADRSDHKPSQLSGGEQQRIAVARALINDPAILLADEPTGSLDQDTAQEVMDLLVGVAGEGRTLLLVTHDPSIASRLDLVYRVRHKSLVLSEMEEST